MDQIFAVKSVLEKAWECNVDTRHISIDFQSDYDNKQRDKLYEIMNFFLEIPNKLIGLIEATNDSVYNVKI
jgi:hypothetical protein